MRVILFLICVISCQLVFTQELLHNWSQSIGGPNVAEFFSDRGMDVVIDHEDNVISVGQFRSAVDFDGGPDDYIIGSGSGSAQFVHKVDDEGNFIWVKNFRQDDNNGVLEFTNVNVDNANNIYVTGTLKGQVDFDTSNNTFFLGTNGSSKKQGFILKLSSEGDFIWANALISERSTELNDFHIDENDNIYLTGLYNETIDFDFGTDTVLVSDIGSPVGNPDTFVLKIDSDANFQWVYPIRSSGLYNIGNYPSSIITHGDSVYFAGTCTGVVDFDYSSGVFQFDDPFYKFVLKLDDQGNFDWVKNFTFAEYTRVHLNVDQGGNVYVSGGVDIGASYQYDSPYLVNPTGDNGFYIFKLDPLGNLIWTNNVTSDTAAVNSISLNFDDNNTIFVGLNISGSGVLDTNWQEEQNTITVPPSSRALLIQADSDGNFISSSLFPHGGTGMHFRNDNLALIGNFSGTINLDPLGDPINALTSVNGTLDIALSNFSLNSALSIEELEFPQSKRKELVRYNLLGQKIPKGTKGFNIIIYDDASVRKVYVL